MDDPRSERTADPNGLFASIRRLDIGNLHPWQCYLFAVVATAVALAAHGAFDSPPVGGSKIVMFTIPIMLSAYVGGLGPGLLATGISLVAANYYLLPPLYGFDIASSSDRWEQILLAVAGVAISALTEALHRMRRKPDGAPSAHHRAESSERENAEKGLHERDLQENLERYRSMAEEMARVNVALYESEKNFRQLAENVSDVFFIHSARGHPHYVSPAYERIWGRSVTSLYANPRQWQEAVLPADAATVSAALARMGVDEPTVTMEYRIVRPDGALRWIHSEATQVRDDSGSLTRTVGTGRDITERKRSEAELEQINRQLLDASRKAGMAEIATNVLHNVGNVLNSVNVSATLAVDSVKQSRAGRMAQVVTLMRDHAADLDSYLTTDAVGQHIPVFLEHLSGDWTREQQTLVTELESLRGNIDHIKQIVAMQQNYARISGMTEIIAVSELVDDAVRVQKGAMAANKITVSREYEVVPEINIAKHKVLPILVNLVRNAKHACYAVPDIEHRIVLRISVAGERVRIDVADDGIGIAPENMTRIFSHGFTTRADGHGFGLHSGALAAAEVGGSLTAHSDGIGRGATFTLELPLQPPGLLE